MFPNSSAMPLMGSDAAREGWGTGPEPREWPKLDTDAVPESVERQIERFWRSGTPRRLAQAEACLQPSPSRSLPRAPLSPFAKAWLQGLPAALQPRCTAQRHPHVVNQLALVWDQPARRAACLRDLLLADRPDRQGFSFEVLEELVVLQACDTAS